MNHHARALALLTSLSDMAHDKRVESIPAVMDAVLEAGGIMADGSRFSGNAWKATFALIVGKSVKIVTVIRNPSDDEKAFIEKEFKIGDVCEYDSFNLRYTAAISGIGSCVSFKLRDGRGRRLSLDEFARRNWRFDAKEVAEQNAVTSMSI